MKFLPNVNLDTKQKIVLIIIFFIIGIAIGEAIAWTQALNWGVEQAIKFLNLDEMNITKGELIKMVELYRIKYGSSP